jgi:endonuclease/exonuclease/phosphatase family metal-dependent hydrolase
MGSITTDYVWNDIRALEIAKNLKAYDIVGLQEVYIPGDNGRKLKMIVAAASLGFKYYVLPQGSVPKQFNTDSGLMILSRYPIVDNDFSMFKKNNFSDSAKGI